MTATAFSGALITFAEQPPNAYNPNQGTSLFFGGDGILDPRLPYTYKPGQGSGRQTQESQHKVQ